MLSQVSGNGASEKKSKAFSRENNVTTREYQRTLVLHYGSLLQNMRK